MNSTRQPIAPLVPRQIKLWNSFSVILFLTVIYQLDGHCRRLLWVGRKRTQATLNRGLDALGSGVVGGLQFVCSDMWQPYLKVLARRAGPALPILDRFHITLHLHQAVDEVRRAESRRLKGQPLAQRLKKRRWKLLRKGSTVRGQAKVELEGLLASRLATGRAWDLKEAFQHFWTYRSPAWAGGFWDYWTERAMRSRLEPLQKVARMLRSHEALILNWFKARGEIATGATEGLNHKIRVVTRRAYPVSSSRTATGAGRSETWPAMPLTSMSKFLVWPSTTPCARSLAPKTTAGVITLRRQFGQKPGQRQNPGLTMPVRRTTRAAITYDANAVRNPSVT